MQGNSREVRGMEAELSRKKRIRRPRENSFTYFFHKTVAQNEEFFP